MRKLRGALKQTVRWRLPVICYFSLLFASIAVCRQTPSGKINISISRIDPVQQNQLGPNGTRPFAQELKVTFTSAKKKDLPTQSDAQKIEKWTVTVSYDDNSKVFLSGTTESCPSQASSCWNVTSTDDSGNSTMKVELSHSAPPVTSTSPAYQAYVQLPDNILTDHVKQVSVDFGAAQSPVWSSSGASSTCTAILCSATNKSTSDNYFSGTYSPAIHSAAQYTIDGQASYVHQVDESDFYIGGMATVSTDQRPSADPDSFLVSSVLQWLVVDSPFGNSSFLGHRTSAAILNWDVAGLEFDRQTTTKTFISSPIVEVPFRVFGHSGSKASMGIFPYGGFETGTNLSNALDPSGSGFVFRGELGSSASLKIKTGWKGLSAIVITSTYTARIPALDEIFTNTHYISATGKTVSLYSLSTETRNHLKDEIDFTVAKPVSITVKHEYGELPPGFRTIRNKVTIGLTVMLFQNNTASSKVSAEQ